MADIYEEQGQFARAKKMHTQSLAVCARSSGEKNADYVLELQNLAMFYRRTMQTTKAIALGTGEQ